MHSDGIRSHGLWPGYVVYLVVSENVYARHLQIYHVICTRGKRQSNRSCGFRKIYFLLLFFSFLDSELVRHVLTKRMNQSQ